MNKTVKLVVLPLAGAVAVLAVLVAYIGATFDPNQYKPQIVQAVKDKTQRTLKLDGDIKLSFFPDIGATLGKGSLTERASDKEFASADDFHIVLKLLPLLSKQVVVDAIEATNLRATLIRYQDGTTNIEDLTSRAGKSAQAVEGANEEFKIDINHVSIKNATITFTDQMAGATYVLSKLDLKTGRIASGVPSKIELSLLVESDRPRLNLETALKTTLNFDFGQQRYALAGLDLGARGIAAGMDDLVIAVTGDVDAQLASGEFLLGRLAVTASGRRDGGELNVKLEAPRLNLTTNNASADKITLDAVWKQAKSNLTVKFDIPAIEGNAQSFTAGQVNADIDVQQGNATTKVRLSSALAGSVDRKRIELSRLAASLNVNNSKVFKNPIGAKLTGSAQIDLAKHNANLTFAARLDDSNIHGKAGLARFVPPFYTFDVDIDQLDADRYLPKIDPKQPQTLDLSALKELNASGTLRIGTLKVANVKAANVRFEFKAPNSRGAASPLAANLYEDPPGGALRVQAAAPLVAARHCDRGF